MPNTVHPIIIHLRQRHQHSSREVIQPLLVNYLNASIYPYTDDCLLEKNRVKKEIDFCHSIFSLDGKKVSQAELQYVIDHLRKYRLRN